MGDRVVTRAPYIEVLLIGGATVVFAIDVPLFTLS